MDVVSPSNTHSQQLETRQSLKTKPFMAIPPMRSGTFIILQQTALGMKNFRFCVGRDVGNGYVGRRRCMKRRAEVDSESPKGQRVN